MKNWKTPAHPANPAKAEIAPVVIAARAVFDTPFTPDQKEQLYRESITWYSRYGVSMRPVPPDYASFERYWNEMLPTLQPTPITHHAIHMGRTPRPFESIPRPVWWLLDPLVNRFSQWLGRGTLPPVLRQKLGMRWSRADQVALNAFAGLVRTVFALLPTEWRYLPTAKAGRRVAREQARARVAQLKDQMQSDGAAGSRRGQAAQRRAAQERQARLEQALRRLPEVQAIKERQGKAAQPARVSTTDAEATVMKMGDGGFRPAYNPQLATDADSLVIVGVDVATVGSDQGQMVPMLEQVTERCGQAPAAWLVDGGFTSHEQIEQAARSTEVYGPVPQPKTTGVDPHQPKAGDSEAVAQWRVRMGTDEAKAIYRRRAATAECVNAQARNRGLQQFLVRGVKKVTCVMLLFALAHNLMRMVALTPELLAHGTGASAATALAG